MTPPNDPIPEVREAAVELMRLPSNFTAQEKDIQESIAEIISQACISYHKRKLAECGDVKQVAEDIYYHRDLAKYPDLALIHLQLHTAKAVENALKLEQNLPSQLLDVNAICQQRDEAVARAEKAEKQLISQEHSQAANKAWLKEFDTLKERAEKAEAEVASIRLAVNTGVVELQAQLSTLQQDVKPMLEYLLNDPDIKIIRNFKGNFIDTFLSKYPELNTP